MGFLSGIIAGIKAFAATNIGGIILKLGLSLAASAISRALMPKPDTSVDQRTYSTTNPVEPRDLVYGFVRKGGQVVFEHAYNNGQYISRVYCLAGHQVQGIGAIYVNGELAVADGASDGTGKYAGKIYVERALGADDQYAFPALRAHLPSMWTTSHRLRGIAAIYVRIVVDQEVFSSAKPNITADVTGKNDIYDPRLGTNGYTNNAALCLADYMAMAPRLTGPGIPYGGTDGIDLNDLVAAANICDEVVDKPDGGTEARYTCNGSLELSERNDHQTIIRGLLSAMGGSVTDLPPYRIRAGAYVAPTLSFGLDDLRGPISVSTKMSASENCNGVKGQFVSPENDWQPDDYPAYQSATYLAEDLDHERWKDWPLPFTTSASMAQRLARIELEKVRRQISVELIGSAKWLQALPGEVIELSIDRYGWTNKPFVIAAMQARISEGALNVAVSLRETSPLVYSWTASEEAIYAAAPATTLPALRVIGAPGVPTITEDTYVTRDGTGLKAKAILTWAASASPYVAQYMVQVQPPGGSWRTAGTTRDTTFEVLDVGAGLWTFRVYAMSITGMVSPYSERQHEIVALSAPPAALTGVALQQSGSFALLTWDQSPDVDVRIGGTILIRHGASWTESLSVAQVPGGDTLAFVPLMAGNYLLRAQDSAGYRGATVSIAADGTTMIGWTNAATLTEDPTFAGAKTNCEIDGSELILTDITQDGLYEFSSTMDFGVVKSVRLRKVAAIAAELSSNLFDSAELFDSIEDFDGTDDADIDVVVECRTTPHDPGGTPTWSGWQRVDVTEVTCRAVQWRLRMLAGASGQFNIRVSSLEGIADEAS